MRRIVLPLALFGLISTGLLAGAARAETSVVVHPHIVGPGYWGPTVVSRVDADTLGALRDEYHRTKAIHERYDDAWDAIKDACEGDDDATMIVDPQTCAETKAADDVAEEAYEDARADYHAARSPLMVDPFWVDRYSLYYPFP